MKIVLDFDDVIFNTKTFVRNYKKIFLAYGISEDIFKECYYGSGEDAQQKKYDPARHIKAIEEKLGKSLDGLGGAASRFIHGGCEQYVFSDALSFLQRNHERGLHLVSFGDSEWQSSKIRRSGIVSFFKKVIVLSGPKSAGIKTILEGDENKNKKIIFLDDRAEIIREVKEKYPQVVTILIRRVGGRYSDKKNEQCDFEAVDLNEAEAIINNVGS
ncbi:hypothetical protein HY798_04685 [Candidatus Falkowbacteria bacterium]|nr:hypothetical protein [Candidatus Falkowbacteria bacterium]